VTSSALENVPTIIGEKGGWSNTGRRRRGGAIKE